MYILDSQSKKGSQWWWSYGSQQESEY